MSKNIKKNRKYLILIILSSLSLFILLSSCTKEKKIEITKPEKRIKLSTTFIEFSTNITISIYNIEKKKQSRVTDLLSKSQDIFQYFEFEMNPINERSTLYKFNQELKKSKNKFCKIPKSLSKLIHESNRIYKESNNYFDISVFPIMDLWGFSSEKTPKIPKKNEIDSLLKKITMENVVIKKDSIMFSNSEVEIGLGAIAKGFAVDSVASYLESNNINDFIIEAGGDLTVRSKNSRAKKVGVRNPRNREALLDTLSIFEGSIATSGDYEKYIIDEKNKRYCHIINPKSGYSDSDCISVTIITTNAYLADAYATAVFLLGSKNGEKFILKNNLKGIIITKDYKTDKIKNIKYINLDKKEVINEKNE